jgi:hypothetical protein
MTKKMLVVLLCWGILLSGVAYGESEANTHLQEFVRQVYQDYAAESFAAVYTEMYPSIQARVSEDEYVAFQRGHFERLSLKVRDVEVGTVTENPRLVRALRQLLSDDESRQVFGVEISYAASFVRGTRYDQSITKTVYVAVVDWGTAHESICLLWDPSAMEEEETEQ